MAAVFYWFGFMQILNPSMFSFYVPQPIADLFGSAELASVYNGVFEIIFATLLLLGAFTRITALLLAIHLVGITITVGFTATGVRDFGLTIATFALVGFGSGKWGLDTFIAKKFSPKWRKRLLLS